MLTSHNPRRKPKERQGIRKKSIKKKATRCTKAPAYAGSGKRSHHLVYCTQPYPVWSHHLVYCTQPYPVFYTRDCFQDLNPWPFSHMTTTLPVAPRLSLDRKKSKYSEKSKFQLEDIKGFISFIYKLVLGG